MNKIDIRYFFKNEPYSHVDHWDKFNKADYELLDAYLKEKLQPFAERIKSVDGFIKVSLHNVGGDGRFGFSIQPKGLDKILEEELLQALNI